jgi:serine/threonine protein kinase/N-acetylneuraminic acid mutarotase
MNPERWQQIDKLFQDCLELEAGQCPALLEEACAGDQQLRDKVEALLASDAERWSFIEQPALELAAPLIAHDAPRLQPGQHISHYKIVELIGRGGMSEVYRARDEILSRSVALKFLPAGYTQDKDRLRRFQREAQAASALNHPNILTIHQLGDVDGQQFIATELVEGETLRQRLGRGPLSAVNATDISIQIASALSSAHKAGIVHRDIKPENIMLRPDGYVKVLDFGLAKLAAQYDSEMLTGGADRVDVSSGLLMGTVRYMSPEQARGLTVDARSDIFSLGVVLYEMVTGRPPFDDKDAARTLDAILNDEPRALGEYATVTPEKLSAIIDRCLSKKRENRYQNADELLIDLKLVKQQLEHDTSDSERLGVAAVERPRPWFSGQISTAERSQRKTTSASLINETRRPRVVIPSMILLIAVSAICYASYKFLRRTRADAAATDAAATKASNTAGKWTTKASISSARSRAVPAVLNGVLYVAGGWNVCTPFANLESYDPVNDKWAQRAPMLTARGGHGVGALNGLLYAVGGWVGCGVETAAVEAYDPVTNTWSSKAGLPSKRGGHAVAVANGKLYAMGGVSTGTVLALNTEYEPRTNKWIERAPIPTPRHAAAAVVVDDIVYVLGGADGRRALTAVEAYNPATNTWMAKAPMLAARANFAAAAANGRIYAFGMGTDYSQIDAYDPATDSWETIGQMPNLLRDVHAVAHDGSIYFAGGFDGINYLSSVIAFAPESAQARAPQCPGSWEAKAPMPSVRGLMALGEINGTIYAVGGMEGDSVFLANNEAYDPATNKWTQKARMPTARAMRGTNNAVVDGKLYVIGGNPRGQCTNVNEVYDPATDTWTAKAPMPTARCHVAVVALNGLIYAIGGNTNTAFSSLVEVYDPTTDSWSRAPSLQTPRQEIAVGVIDGIIYAVGGFGQYGSLNIVEAYDPKNPVWTAKASMPTPRSGLAAAVINGSLVVVGGENNHTALNTVEVYDPATDTWRTETSMPAARVYLSAVTVNNTFYAVGGGSAPYLPGSLTTNEAYRVLPCVRQ